MGFMFCQNPASIPHISRSLDIRFWGMGVAVFASRRTYKKQKFPQLYVLLQLFHFFSIFTTTEY